MQIQEKWCQVRLKVWGEHALFTRPEMKVERVSYDMYSDGIRLTVATGWVSG